MSLQNLLWQQSKEQQSCIFKCHAEHHYWTSPFLLPTTATQTMTSVTSISPQSYPSPTNSAPYHCHADGPSAHRVCSPAGGSAARPTPERQLAYLVLHYWARSTQVLVGSGQADSRQGCSTDLSTPVNWMHPVGKMVVTTSHSYILPVKTRTIFFTQSDWISKVTLSVLHQYERIKRNRNSTCSILSKQRLSQQKDRSWQCF